MQEGKTVGVEFLRATYVQRVRRVEQHGFQRLPAMGVDAVPDGLFVVRPHGVVAEARSHAGHGHVRTASFPLVLAAALSAEVVPGDAAQHGVDHVDKLQTRIFGSRVYVDVEVSADDHLTLYEAHAIAENIHEQIEQNFPEVKHCMVHINPCSETHHNF